MNATDLIIKFLRDELTPEDRTELQKWVGTSEDNRVYFDKITGGEPMTTEMKKEMERSWQKILIKINKQPFMQPLTIDGNTARKIYPTAVPEVKLILEQSFGQKFFAQNIMDRVKTFEDACALQGIDPKQFFTACCYNNETKDEVAYKMLKIIVKALNEDWVPNFNNTSQAKWYPWFYLNEPGFRFLIAFYFYSGSFVGSRLCFKSRELAEYAAKQFLTIYKDLFTI